MKKLKLLLVLLLNMNSALAIDKVLSEAPVKVPLSPNKEIIIKFPYAVIRTDILEGDPGDKLSQLLRPDGVLLLKAGEPFGKVRMAAPMVDGSLVILDLEATVGAINYQKINLIDPKTLKKKVAKSAPTLPPQENPNKPAFLKNGGAMTKNAATTKEPNIGYAEMVQFALRHQVGPSRLIGEVHGKKVTLSKKGLTNFIRLWGDYLSIKPLNQWKVNEFYVTSLKVKNRSPRALSFDPRAFRGRVITAAALHPTLQPKGSERDETIWVIITGIPFNQAIGGRVL